MNREQKKTLIQAQRKKNVKNAEKRRIIIIVAIFYDLKISLINNKIFYKVEYPSGGNPFLFYLVENQHI